ncbi:GumC family protein (plasmid) [Roseobacteraceae bacterium NS-SX3]
MDNAKYYFSLFLRRLHYFLAVATVVSAVSVGIAYTLPPTYVSRMMLMVESPQIPGDLAPSTVNTPAQEQLQIAEQRLLTRPVLLEIAEKLKPFPEQAKMSPDQIVGVMRDQTRVQIDAGRGQATLMGISFEASTAEAAAGVLNEYLTRIQQQNLDYRQQRATQTLAYFQQEVDRLSSELNRRGTRILDFKEKNADALPSNLQFRQAQQGTLQTNLEQVSRQIYALQSQRDKLLEVYRSTGQIVGVAPQNLTPEERQLQALRNQLSADLVVFSETNPKIRMLKARIASLERTVAAQQTAPAQQADASRTGNPALDLQLTQIDTQIQAQEEQKAVLEQRLDAVTESIGRTPANAITLADLQRDYDNIQGQYNAAVDRLARASTGERIEVMSQGQRISVIEHPAVPGAPEKPDRMLIAGGGTAAGIALGLGLVLLLELLNRSVRRPEDLISQLEVWPIATIPYVRTRGELLLQRVQRAGLIVVILVGIPAAVWTFHTRYQPLDVTAERVMSKLGVRW